MAKEKIGEIFVKAGLIDEEELTLVLEENRKNPHEQLGETLVRLKFANERDLAKAMSFQLGIPFLDLKNVAIDPKAIERIPLKLVKKHHLLPVYFEGRNLVVAMKDPLDNEAVDMARFAAGLNIRPNIAPGSDIDEALLLHYGAGDSIDRILKNLAGGVGVEFIGDEYLDEEDLSDLKRKSQLAPIVKLVNSIVITGITSRASDIHIEPQERELLVRNRIDGILSEAMRAPKWVQGALVSRIKIMCGMDISERRIPQDGKVKLRMDEKIVDLRVSTLPTQYGEKVVIRILETGKNITTTGELGLLPDELVKLQEMIHLSQGMILVCGPTGSGKTTTIYALINEIVRKKVNIITLEDPIEYRIDGANQVQINEKAGLTFAKALRSILRQDPNVVFVGEIRDGETADIAMRSSLTGHLVLSTVHTNDAVSTINRLKDLEIEPYLIASSLSGIVSQRLVRVICENCRDAYDPSEEMVKKIEARLGKEIDFLFYRGKGCELCQHTGYKGRIGVYEILVMAGEIRELINQGASEGKIRTAAVENGMGSLIEDALEKIKQGITTVEELDRVLFAAQEDEPAAGLKCPHCQKPLEPEWQTCPFCSHAVKAFPDAGVVLINDPEKIPSPGMGEGNGDDYKGFKILLVDDDEILVQALAFLLLKKQFDLTTAANGREALESIRRVKPHLVITDILMPEMDGLELIRRLRKEIATAFIPVIVLSQKGEIEDRLEGFEVGTDDYLAKPFSMDELVYRVRAVLRRTYR